MNNTNKLTRSTSASHNGQADSDTKKEYEVSLSFIQYSKATIIIEAVSQEEAECNADEICADEIDDWNPYDGEIEVLDVSPVKDDQP